MQAIHSQPMHNKITQESKRYFADLIAKYKHLEALTLDCTEYPMLLDGPNSLLPVVNPVHLQSTRSGQLRSQQYS